MGDLLPPSIYSISPIAIGLCHATGACLSSKLTGVSAHSLYVSSMDIEEVKGRVRRAIDPLKQAELDQSTYHQLFMSAKRTDAGRNLPAYYLIYFLLVDLLGFRNNGQWEKTAWSVTVEYDQTPFLIDHRKFGLGIFGMSRSEAIATRVATCLHKAVKAAEPYFEWRAEEAAKQSHLNVVNRSSDLFEHVYFFWTYMTRG